jgi:hypothetical protein
VVHTALHIRAIGARGGAGARALELKPGAQMVARVVTPPNAGGRGVISLAGQQVQAQLPPGVQPGAHLKLTVTRVQGHKVTARVEKAPARPRTGSVARVAGRMALSRNGDVTRAALAMAGDEPLWLPDGSAATVTVDPDAEGAEGSGDESSGEAAFVLHSPTMGAIEVRLRMAQGAITAGVVTAPGPATDVADAASAKLVEALANATGRPASAAVLARPANVPPPPPPTGRIDLHA